MTIFHQNGTTDVTKLFAAAGDDDFIQNLGRIFKISLSDPTQIDSPKNPIKKR